MKIAKFRKNGRINKITPGIYTGISNDKYHSSHHYSSSEIKYFHGGDKTPAHYQADKAIFTPPTARMKLGSAVHSLVLEPELFHDEFVEEEKFDKRTKQGKADYEQFCQAHAGKILLTTEMVKQAYAMKESVRRHPIARSLVNPNHGVPEVSIFWENKVHGFDCKARPDFIYQEKVLVDLKTTDNAGANFPKICAKFNYDLSAAWYEMGFHSVYDELPERFMFIVVERQPPYLCNVYEASGAFLRNGHAKCERAQLLLEHCIKTNEWPGYSNHIEMLDLPMWAMEEIL